MKTPNTKHQTPNKLQTQSQWSVVSGQWSLILLLFSALCIASLTGCKHRLEPGGAYNPVTTNATGVVTEHPDLALYLSDETWRLSYSAALLICNQERDNRELIRATFGPGIKAALDEVRPTLADINLRWAKSRQAYKATPTPENLNTIDGILAELERVLAVIQTQRPAITKALAAKAR